MSEAFLNNWEYLNAELARLDILVQAEVVKCRPLAKDNRLDSFRSLFISEDEVTHLLGTSESDWHVDEVEQLRTRAELMRKEIWSRRQASTEQGVYLSLPQLARIFRLSPFEEDLVLICLAPEIDLKYERLYAYLQDDLTRRLPTVQLALELLCISAEERGQARIHFTRQAILFRSQILRFEGDNHASSLGNGLKLDERISGFVLGTDGMDRGLRACFKASPPPVELDVLRWNESLKTDLLNLTRDYLQHDQKPLHKLIFNFHGLAGAGRKTLAATLCRECGVPLIIVDLREVLRQPHFEDAIRSILREAVLQPGAIYLEHFDLIANDDEGVSRQQLISALEEFSWLTFLSTEKPWAPGGALRQHVYIDVELSAPGLQERTDLWAQLAGNPEGFAPDVSWEDLAVKFRLTPGQINDALVVARNRARLRGKEIITADDLHRGCRAQSNQKLSTAA
ncbi:MAG TPA: AAA family ATPase, partial [Pyrinomonadaceae bacterium]|nr:AAA family ATPase [Pyrinomonadaceae bacterium]